MLDFLFPDAPVWVEIDTGRFRRNLLTVREHLPPQCEIVVVLKSDAYGHGMLELADAARRERSLGRIGIATNEEALALRESGFDNPLLKLVPSLPEELEEVVDLGMEEIVSDLGRVQSLSEIATEQGRQAHVHVALDTGMGRKGLLEGEAARSILKMATQPNIEVVGLMTHFPIADDEDKTFTLEQIASYDRVRDALAREGLTLPLCHVANSAALLDLTQAQMSAVRAGLILYGMYPSEHNTRLEGIQPVMSFHTRIALLREVPAGHSIGYTRSYVTPSARRIATLPLGYNDGYFRHLSNRAQVLIGGVRAPVVGMVSMNLVTVDVTELPDVEIGQEVVLLGEQGEDAISADEFAAWAGTINYEVTTRIGRVNHRVIR